MNDYFCIKVKHVSLEKSHKSVWKHLLTSENHFENKLWLFISIRTVDLYICCRVMLNFWAKALQREVFPVPGGPCNRITLLQLIILQSTSLCANNIMVWAYFKSCKQKKGKLYFVWIYDLSLNSDYIVN